jgi:hypothetical protein
MPVRVVSPLLCVLLLFGLGRGMAPAAAPTVNHIYAVQTVDSLSSPRATPSTT